MKHSQEPNPRMMQNKKAERYQSSSRRTISRLGCFVLLLGSNLHLMTMLQLIKNNPRRNKRKQSNTEVESDTDKMVRVTLGLHSPCNSLTQRLESTKDTTVVGKRG